MYDDELGTFRGRYEDCAKIKIDTAQLNQYLNNPEKRESEIRSIMNKKSEMLEKNPKMKEFLSKYSESLAKSSAFYKNAHKVQEKIDLSQLTM